eukprot:gene17337-biopygen14399
MRKTKAVMAVLESEVLTCRLPWKEITGGVWAGPGRDSGAAGAAQQRENNTKDLGDMIAPTNEIPQGATSCRGMSTSRRGMFYNSTNFVMGT